MRDYLGKILSGESLSVNEASAAMDLIMNGDATPAQIAGLIVALKQKGETAEEVAGFVKSMRQHAVGIKLDDAEAVDGCGTGGDGSNSFNISTAAAIVTAAAGVTVAKHGNRSISSRCGSADLLEATGGNIDPGAETVRDNINDVGFGFMFAPRFHPAMKHAAVPRKELGVSTIFNILGPMTNPAGITRQVIGVFSKELMSLMGDVLQMTGSRHVILVHATDGLDEFSVSAPTEYLEINDGARSSNEITPEQVGLAVHPAASLAGGDSSENLAILNGVLAGEQSGCRDAVLFNAGAMIYVAGRVGSIREGVEMATTAIENGSAAEKMMAWTKASSG